jgi:hypothetical protein
MAYKTTNRLAITDAAYIAGLLDGEGTVTLSRRHRGDGRQLVVSIANTERRLVEFVLARVGAGKITRKRVAVVHYTPSCTYSISNRQALTLLQQLLPFLHSHKRERTQLVLRAYTTLVPRNGKCTSHSEQLRHEFENQFFAITSRCFETLRESHDHEEGSPSDS